MTEYREVCQKLKSFLIENYLFGFEEEEIDCQIGLDKLGIDSLGMFSIVGFIQSEFEIGVAEDDLNKKNFSNLDGIINFIMEKMQHET